MAKVTYLQIEEPGPGKFLIKEVSAPSEANAASAHVLGSNRFNAFHGQTASLLGEDFTDFYWPAGPIEIRGVVNSKTFSIGLEIVFNDGDAGHRSVGVFWASLKEGLHIEYTGSTNASIDVTMRDGKYVHVDAERGQWAKKRVILILPEEQ